MPGRLSRFHHAIRRLNRPLLVALAAATVGAALLAPHDPPPPRHPAAHALPPTHRTSPAGGSADRHVNSGHHQRPAPHRTHTAARPRSYCSRPTTGQFQPTSISLPGIRRAPVLALARDATNHPGVAPVDEAGKHEFSWDAPGPQPGSVGGNVLVNAHTWPWGTAPALGNRMLLRLQPGDTIIVRGEGAHLCYRVTARMQRPAGAAFSRYYRVIGPPQLAIMVCSGTRLGPEDWADRTVWFASPVA